eukprot:gene28821-4955_t
MGGSKSKGAKPKKVGGDAVQEKVFFDNTEKTKKKVAATAYKGFDPEHPTELNVSQVEQHDREKEELKTSKAFEENFKGFSGAAHTSDNFEAEKDGDLDAKKAVRRASVKDLASQLQSS